jgi:hypothetical protein
VRIGLAQQRSPAASRDARLAHHAFRTRAREDEAAHEVMVQRELEALQGGHVGT